MKDTKYYPIFSEFPKSTIFVKKELMNGNWYVTWNGEQFPKFKGSFGHVFHCKKGFQRYPVKDERTKRRKT